MNEAPKLPTLPPQGYGNDGWCEDDVLAFGLQCWKAGAAWPFSFGTSTVQALVKRGLAEYTEWKDGRNGRFPVRMALKPGAPQ